MNKMKSFMTAVALILALSGCATLNNRDLAVKAAYGAVVADVASTKYALDKGCVETNPILGENPNDGILVGNLVISLGLVKFLDNYIEDQSVTWPFWVLSVIRGGAAVNNMSLECARN